MDTLSYKTKSANAATADKQWVVVDASHQVLGRFASRVAFMIRGKHKTNFTPHVDCGDNLIVVNADKIRLTGKKWTDKIYQRYTGHPGGQRDVSARLLKEKKGGKAMVEMAVKNMLPKSRLGRAIYGNLYVYDGPEHPHAGQNPKPLEL